LSVNCRSRHDLPTPAGGEGRGSGVGGRCRCTRCGGGEVWRPFGGRPRPSSRATAVRERTHACTIPTCIANDDVFKQERVAGHGSAGCRARTAHCC
jgi:hypothetical protein